MSNNQHTLFGHPVSLFVLFFTEMWERFSYYGMRALLVLFLVSDIALGGWGWSNYEALTLYGIYTGLVYVTPIFGGILADKLIGHKKSVILGAFLMSCGHASMALEQSWSFYLGLTLLILGNGAFKPNVSSIVGTLYKDNESNRKDSAYTIFYMGINAGAFLGILLCGYVGEKVGWSFGFGLAGIFMFLGMIQFYFSRNRFPEETNFIKSNKHTKELDKVEEDLKYEKELLNKAQKKDIESANTEISNHYKNISDTDKNNFINKFLLFKQKKIVSDRLVVLLILAFFTIFFWMAFEQAGGSMTIFAKNFTNRTLTGTAAYAFKIFNTAITVIPLLIISYILILLFIKTDKKYLLSSITLSVSFIIIWGIALWLIVNEFNLKTYVIEYNKETNYEKIIKHPIRNNTKNINQDDLSEIMNTYDIHDFKTINIIKKNKENIEIKVAYSKENQTTGFLRTGKKLDLNTEISIVESDGQLKLLENTNNKKNTKAVIKSIKTNQIEIPSSWFGVLNSLFIILLAPLFSKLWETKFNPPAAVKFALGIIFLGLGFGLLALGALNITDLSGNIKVSMVWLVLAYFMHTTGEIVLSPVGLSYVAKLSPKKLVGFMFGVWFTATAIANYLAGITGSLIDKISSAYSLSVFFLIFTILPILSGIILLILSPYIKKKMHNIH